MFSIPFICVGDFNMSPQQLAESGLMQLFQADIFATDLASTLVNSGTSNIDFGFKSKSMENVFVRFSPVFDTVWYPHIGFFLALVGTPIVVQGIVQILPKSLRMEEFNQAFSKLNRYEQYFAWTNAVHAAGKQLKAHKKRHGIAILGPGPKAVDPKFAFLIAQSIELGENLALQALAIEQFVLKIAGVPDHQWKQYVGRSQFPRFKKVSIVRRQVEDSKYSCPF